MFLRQSRAVNASIVVEHTSMYMCRRCTNSNSRIHLDHFHCIMHLIGKSMHRVAPLASCSVNIFQTAPTFVEHRHPSFYVSINNGPWSNAKRTYFTRAASPARKTFDRCSTRSRTKNQKDRIERNTNIRSSGARARKKRIAASYRGRNTRQTDLITGERPSPRTMYQTGVTCYQAGSQRTIITRKCRLQWNQFRPVPCCSVASIPVTSDVNGQEGCTSTRKGEKELVTLSGSR